MTKGQPAFTFLTVQRGHVVALSPWRPITMKALAAVEETEDDRRSRRLVFARLQIEKLNATIASIAKQRDSFLAKELENAMPSDHPALVACEKRRDAELARRATARGGSL